MKKQTPITDFIKAYIEEIRAEQNKLPCFSKEWDIKANEIWTLARVQGFAEATENNWTIEEIMAQMRKDKNAEPIGADNRT